MNSTKLITGINIISLMSVALGEQLLSADAPPKQPMHITRVALLKTPSGHTSIQPALANTTLSESGSALMGPTADGTRLILNRRRREELALNSESKENSDDDENSFQKEEIGWSNINEEVDMVIPMVLAHLQKLDIDFLQLPDMKESISLNPLLITYEAGLFLTNGIVYNIAGIQRHGDAFMTYADKAFLSRFNIIIKSLQFEYNFLIKLMALEGYGKVIGSLDDTVIYAELAVNVGNLKLKLNDFRIVRFSNIHVQLDQSRILGMLSGVILSPLTNLFRDRITTSISDGLKGQMQMVMDDFNDADPLELKKFTKQLVAGLLGQKKNESNINK